MKVRILSGNDAGSLVEMDTVAAESAVATGFAEAVAEDGSPLKATVAELKQAAPEKKKAKAKRK
jgi:hypothetical protein